MSEEDRYTPITAPVRGRQTPPAEQVMTPELSEIFAKYEKLVAETDAVFEKVREMHPDCVRCEVKCADCCHALFDLSLVEAMYMNAKFADNFSGKDKSDILDRAGEADRRIYKIKKQAYKDTQDGLAAEDIMVKVARERVRCPLLNDEDTCAMYDHRPITCRLYGVPTAIAGKGHTCAKSGFKGGEKYPTVNMDILHDRLVELSQEIVEALGSAYTDLPRVFVPLSMAIMNKYDDKYLGIGNEEDWDPNRKEK